MSSRASILKLLSSMTSMSLHLQLSGSLGNIILAYFRLFLSPKESLFLEKGLLIKVVDLSKLLVSRGKEKFSVLSIYESSKLK